MAKDQKFDLLIALLERTNFDSCLIFTEHEDMADKVAHRLKEMKHSVAVLHSNRTQREREEALEGFKSGKYEVMVATDIAARGLDIAGVSHVINYDVPEHPGGLRPSHRPHRPRADQSATRSPFSPPRKWITCGTSSASSARRFRG